MDSLLDESCMDSDVISVDGDEIIQLTNTIVGVIYYYVSYSFFIYKFKRRFFQLKGNTLIHGMLINYIKLVRELKI